MLRSRAVPCCISAEYLRDVLLIYDEAVGSTGLDASVRAAARVRLERAFLKRVDVCFSSLSRARDC